MNITKIELYNFRNYNKLILKDLKKINILIGKNGVGKTSILESIYLGSIGKSFRTNSDSSIVKENSLSYKINLKLKEDKKITNLEILYQNKGKITKINKKTTNTLSEYIGAFKSILFSPDEVKLIKSSPNVRRNYLNIQLSQLEKKYLFYLQNYNKLIKNKNEYLKCIELNKSNDLKYLDILDSKIIEEGTKIFNYRKKYVTDINNILSKLKYKDKISLKYISDFENDEKSIEKKIKSLRKKEILLGISSFGVHRDDVEFLYNNQNAKEFCSQGQQKILLLFLKLSEIDLFINKYNYKPILLLDDLFSELDYEHQNLIINKLSKNTQIFITATDINNIENQIKRKINVINIDNMEELK